MKPANVAMPGAQSNRTDKSVVSRVQKVQRDAKFSRMAGGEYNSRNSMAATVQEGGVNLPTASAVSQDTPMVSQNQLASQIQQVAATTPTGLDRPLSHGAMGGPGADASINMPPVDNPNSGEMLARAMYIMNPTPQLRRIVEAFNEASSLNETMY